MVRSTKRIILAHKKTGIKKIMKDRKKKKKVIEETASFRKDIPETSDSKLSRKGLVDRVPGKPRVVTHQEWLHQKRVEKGVFFGNISTGDDFSFSILDDKEMWNYEMKESIIGGSEDKMVRMSEILEEDDLIIMEKLRKNLLHLEVENLKFYFDESGPNFSFNFPDKSKLNFVIGSIIQIDEVNNLIFNGIFLKSQPFLLSLNLEEDFNFENTASTDWNYFKKTLDLDDDFKKIFESLNYLKIEKKSIEFSFTKSMDLEIILELVKGFYEELLNLK